MLRTEFKNDYEEAIRSIDSSASLCGRWDPYNSRGSDKLRAARSELCARFAWAIPCPAAIWTIHDVVTKNGLAGIIEIGAGTGYWAYCLKQVGVDCICVDSFAWHAHRAKQWHPVERGGPPAASKHPDRALFLCWPPMTTHKAEAGRVWRRQPKYETTLPWNSPERDAEYKAFCAAHGDWSWWHKQVALRCGPTNMGGASIARYTGEWVIYVGESEGGCTGDDTMFELLRRDFTLVERAPVYQYDGIHDELCVYRRGRHEECER